MELQRIRLPRNENANPIKKIGLSGIEMEFSSINKMLIPIQVGTVIQRMSSENRSNAVFRLFLLDLQRIDI